MLFRSLELARAHEEGEKGENFLGASEGEGGDEHGPLAGEDVVKLIGEALNLRFPCETHRRGAVATGGFHDEHVGLHVLEAGRL